MKWRPLCSMCLVWQFILYKPSAHNKPLIPTPPIHPVRCFYPCPESQCKNCNNLKATIASRCTHETCNLTHCVLSRRILQAEGREWSSQPSPTGGPDSGCRFPPIGPPYPVCVLSVNLSPLCPARDPPPRAGQEPTKTQWVGSS